MACTVQEKDYIRSMLKDTIRMLVKHGLTYKSKFNIEGLLGITVDDSEVFLISVNELVQEDETLPTADSDVEFIDTKTDIQSCPRPGQGARKRRRLTSHNNDRNDASSGDESCNSLSPVGKEDLATNHKTPHRQQKANHLTNTEPFTDLPKYINIKTEVESERWASETNEIDPQQSDSLIQESASFYRQSSCLSNSGSVSAFSNTGYPSVELCVTSRTKGGRPMDIVWDYYNRVDYNGRVHAMCRTCGNRVSAKAGRLRDHLKKCCGITLPPPKSQHSILMDLVMEHIHTKQGQTDGVVDSCQNTQGHSDIVFPENNPNFRPSVNSGTGILNTSDQDTDRNCLIDRSKGDPDADQQKTSTVEQYSVKRTANCGRVISTTKTCIDLISNTDDERIKQECVTGNLAPDFAVLENK